MCLTKDVNLVTFCFFCGTSHLASVCLKFKLSKFHMLRIASAMNFIRAFTIHLEFHTI
jgi:hypothetical protein